METLPEWRPVVGHPDYAVSNEGRVWSWRTRRMMAVSIMKKGYARIRFRYRLEDPPRLVERYVHQLVMEAFVGPRPPRTEVNHIDGDTLNNRLGNLEYVPHAENLRHAFRVLRRNVRGHRPALTLEDREKIRALRDAGLTYEELARIYRRDPSRMSQIYKRIAC
jgi:hypothetical protein